VEIDGRELFARELAERLDSAKRSYYEERENEARTSTAMVVWSNLNIEYELTIATQDWNDACARLNELNDEIKYLELARYELDKLQ
jgi:hypothetical protein